ncbi:MAG: TauD/TfdA family dioxygenase [Pseudomonadota bacterium]
MTELNVTPTDGACGAVVSGINFSEEIPPETVAKIRKAWMQYHVLVFEDQQLTDTDLERVTRYFGGVGEDPYFESIDETTPVVALTRKADERAPVFAEGWHSDWSFKENPPVGTLLYAITIPPVGGQTSFANQHAALAAMPKTLRDRLEHQTAIHSAAHAYAPDGVYGEEDAQTDRSLKIVYSESARDTYEHPLIRVHPENQQAAIFSTYGYIQGLKGMAADEAKALLMEMYQWQSRPEFHYQHTWEPGMLVIWDNRSVLHRAHGGYDGYERELHRTTIAPDPSLFVSLA